MGAGGGGGAGCTESEYMVAALRLAMRRSAATISKKVGRVEPSPPSDTNDMALRYARPPSHSCSDSEMSAAYSALRQ